MSIRSQLERVLPSKEEMRAFRIWDGHIHLTTPGKTPEERLERLMELADNMGIERLVLARGVPPYSRSPDPAELRRQNDDVMRAVRRFPTRALATVYLNPRHPDDLASESSSGSQPASTSRPWIPSSSWRRSSKR
jgi:hypothetical protein